MRYQDEETLVSGKKYQQPLVLSHYLPEAIQMFNLHFVHMQILPHNM